MLQSTKQKIPLLFLLIISVSWGVYYLTNNSFNDFGNAKHEAFLLIDGLIVLPILCFLCIADKKEAFIKALVYMCLIVLLGSFIIPDSNKHIWSLLEFGRYIIIATFLLFEASVIISVCLAVSSRVKEGGDIDIILEESISKFFGNGIVSRILLFESRVWTFALLGKHISSSHYNGYHHFYYDKKDGNQSNALGFILLLILEMPLMHIFLHFVWSPVAANVVSILTVLSVIFFYAEYRAMSKRPVSITNDSLIIRYGVLNPFSICLNNISVVRVNTEFVKRGKHLKRFNFSGVPNVELLLVKPINGVSTVYLGVNEPTALIKTLRLKTI